MYPFRKKLIKMKLKVMVMFVYQKTNMFSKTGKKVMFTVN